jgi:hypothetical protein
MKTTTIKTLFGSLLFAGAFALAPVAVFAAGATTTTSVKINTDGIVRVANAEVTSVSGNIINAVTRFKNNVVSWAFTTNASTTIAANNSHIASTTDIKVGDKLNVTGALSAFGSTISVAATKVLDITSMASWRAKSGTVQSINTSNGTFVLKSGDKLITVQTNASTTFRWKSSATTTLATLPLNAKVRVAGAANSDGTFIAASNIMVVSFGKSSVRKENKGADQGLKNGWKDMEDRDNEGEHKGFLKVNLGLRLNDDNDDNR